MPLFSVVVPTYNRAGFIAQTLNSVLHQEFTDYELIVVDDGSCDGTAEVLKDYCDSILYIRQHNQGPGAARNLGIKQSRGEYVAFLDSDDVWFPWTLSTFAQIIKDAARPSFIAGTLFPFEDDADFRDVKPTPLATEYFPDYFASSHRTRWCGSGHLVVLRQLLLQVEGFVNQNINCEDHDLVMRLGTAAGFVNVLSPSLIGYRQHKGAVTRDLEKTFQGGCFLLQRELTSHYPGGPERRSERRRILTSHIRPISIALLGQGEVNKAWRLYRETFAWHISLGRLKYLVGFLAKAALSLLRGCSKTL